MGGFCNVCQVNVTKSYKNHILQHFEELQALNRCTICNRKFRNKYSLKHHVNQQHDVTKRMAEKCNYCEKTFGSRKGLKHHLIKKHSSNIDGGSAHKCLDCDLDCLTKTGLSDHSRSVHGAAKLDCKKCGKCFVHASNLIRHKKQYCNTQDRNKLVGKLFFCSLCPTSVRFKEMRNLSAHQKAFHQNIERCMYKCRFCIKTFKSRSGKYYHEKKEH